jgi:hypothetical protein
MKTTAAQICEAAKLLQTPRKVVDWIVRSTDTRVASQRCYAIATAMAAREKPLEAAILILKSWVGMKGPEMTLVLRLLEQAKTKRVKNL